MFISGGTATGVASNVYTFLDTDFQPFSLFRFQHGIHTISEQFTFGCVPTEVTWDINTNVFELSTQGISIAVSETPTFSSDDTVAKGGLTVWPAEPTSPTTVGAIISGIPGVAMFDGSSLTATTAVLAKCQIKAVTGSNLFTDGFGDPYPTLQLGGERQVEITFSIVDNDHAALNDLKLKAKLATPLPIIIQVGTVAGQIVTFAMQNFQLNVPDYNDQADYVEASFATSMAHATAIGSIDDLTVVFS